MSPVPTVGWAMVVLTSGIVDEVTRLVVSVPSQYCSLSCLRSGGCGTGGRGLVGGVGTLLGLKDRVAHCWALRNQAGRSLLDGVGGGWLLGGCLFEICIVDASIL